jgi:hypothetical protein
MANDQPPPPPKLYISYSWDPPEHAAWVLNFATELRESGVDVILDKWRLKEGHDANAFMEQMVTAEDVRKVAIVCNKTYVEKANQRRGGVGTEAQILTPDLYTKTDQDKFVAIIVEKDDDGNPYVPAFYTGRIYIDLTDDHYAPNFEQVVRWVFGQRVYVEPELGQPPSYITQTPAAALGTSAVQRRALDAVQHAKPYARGALTEYYNRFATNLERFRITDPDTPTMDEAVVASIETLRPYRDEAVELFLAIAQYRPTAEAYQQLHGFFEQLLPYFEQPDDVSRWHRWQADHFKFLVHELFLYCLASLIKYEAFDAVSYLVRQDYLIAPSVRRNTGRMEPYGAFRRPLEAVDAWNKRQTNRMQSAVGFLLRERANFTAVPFDDLMQADLVLLLRAAADAKRQRPHAGWFPDTLVYAERWSGAMPLFARAQSREYFDRLAVVFGISTPDEFEALVVGPNQEKLIPLSWDGWPSFVDVPALLNFGQLGKRP